MSLRNIHLVFKILSAFSLLGFSVWYGSSLYNVIAIIILAALLRREKISLFRFRRQGYLFSFFLILMFLFQAAGTYGEVLITIPPGVSVTDQGLAAAALFVSRILMVFLLFGLAIYSTDRDELILLFQRADAIDTAWGRTLQRAGRLTMYVFYLLPRSFEDRDSVSRQLQNELGEAPGGPGKRIRVTGDAIYRFFHGILELSRREFGRFLNEYRTESRRQPLSLVNRQALIMASLLIGVHMLLFLN